jgi:hypothetical protein
MNTYTRVVHSAFAYHPTSPKLNTEHQQAVVNS